MDVFTSPSTLRGRIVAEYWYGAPSVCRLDLVGGGTPVMRCWPKVHDDAGMVQPTALGTLARRPWQRDVPEWAGPAGRLVQAERQLHLERQAGEATPTATAWRLGCPPPPASSLHCTRVGRISAPPTKPGQQHARATPTAGLPLTVLGSQCERGCESSPRATIARKPRA